jgi:hypothetical protein
VVPHGDLVKIKLTCSPEQQRALIEACDKARKGSRFVKVERDAVMALIVDQSRLVNANRVEVE